MKHFLFLVSIYCLLSVHAFSQAKVYTVQEGEKIIPIKNYTVAVSLSNKNAVFYKNGDTVMHCFGDMLKQLNEYLDKNKFFSEDTFHLFSKVYFNKTGTIDYYTYELKPRTKEPMEAVVVGEKEKLFKKLLTQFVQTYKFPLSADKKFSQVGATTLSSPVSDSVQTAMDVNKYRKMFLEQLPYPVQYVNDYEHIFTAQDANKLNTAINEFHKRSNVSIALMTLDTVLVARDQFDNTLKLMRDKWRKGQQGPDNNILIGLCATYGKIVVLTGTDISKKLPDSDIQTIENNDFVPYYQKGEYGNGTYKGIEAIMQKIESNH